MSLIPGIINAQTVHQIPVICGPLEKNLELIADKYNEKPFFLGNDNLHEQFDVSGLSLAVFVNKITDTFTVALMSNEQKRICIISSGVGTTLPNNNVKY